MPRSGYETQPRVATRNAGVSPAMSAERNEVERSANPALAAEILLEVVVATGLVRASLRCAWFALIAGGTPAFPEERSDHLAEVTSVSVFPTDSEWVASTHTTALRLNGNSSCNPG